MADAEVKLNFTASVEQARAAIAEIAAAMEKLRAEGGLMRPEDAALLNEMQGRLVAYKARIDELEQAYRALRNSGGEANEAALQQVKGLQEQVETLTKQQSALVDKVLELQVANNKVKGGVKEVADETERAGAGGVRVTRSMRGIVANFIRDLMRGRLAVRELGLALKGLAYSTVVLGAIQLAMEGIGFAWEKIKGVFTGSKEEMEAAEEAAKRAQDALDDAKRAAENAAREVQQLKRKLAEKEEAEALKATLAAITAEYVAQRDAVAATLSDIKEQAQVRARERAAEAAAKTGELDLELLGLEERFVSGDIGKRDYVIQKAEIEKRKREEARVAEVDAAEIERDAATARTKAAKAELKNAQDRVTDAATEAGKYATDNDVELAESEHEQLRTRMEEKYKELEKLEAEFEEKYNGRSGFLSVTREQMEHELRTGRILHKETRQYKADKERIADARNVANIASDRELAKAGEVKELKESAARGKEASARLNEERKTAEKLEKDADAAVKAEKTANDALRETLRRTAREGGLDDRSSNIRLRTQLNAIDREEAAGKRRELDRAVKDVAKQVRAAGNSKDDTEDDAAAFRAVGDLLGAQGREIARYGVNVRDLIALCGKLNLGNENSRAKIKALDGELRALQRRVDKNLSRS